MPLVHACAGGESYHSILTDFSVPTAFKSEDETAINGVEQTEFEIHRMPVAWIEVVFRESNTEPHAFTVFGDSEFALSVVRVEIQVF